ncbi:MAG TPA: glycosyltransferase N-terminal domain-containing protein [Pirellulaceae bacterium]|nr:glycosyltransferase N-terminal domain-containing protein [Pirellulaceae bacterium]
MSLILDGLYFLALLVSLPYLAWRRWRFGKNRRGWRSRLWGDVSVPPKHSPRIWFHAVSVGEVTLIAPLIRLIREHHPTWELVLSTGTETGFDVARNKYPDIPVCFCPWDFSWAVRGALRRIDPDCLVLVELELWPNLIRAAKRRGVRLAIVNGRLSDRSFRRYRRFRACVGPLLKRFDLIAAQTEEITQRFVELGADASRVHRVGNLKFDGAIQHTRLEPDDQLVRTFGIEEEECVWVAGSTQPEEDLWVIDVYEKLRAELPRLRLVIAPRHPANAPQAMDYLVRCGLSFLQRSQGEPTESALVERPVIVVDVLGELATWWRRADIAYVGGSQGSRGGQNMIEPSAMGAAVCFGPRTDNFRDVVQLLLAADAARVVSNKDELREFVHRAATDSAWRSDMGCRAQRVVQQNLGASTTTLQLMEQNCDLTPLQESSPSSTGSEAFLKPPTQ